jgi:thiamine biosynthesis lipoprotein
VDLSSIAKGFGVDQIAKLLRDNGFTDFIVEIGGEVVASGKTKGGSPWKIGINTPDKDAPMDQVYKTVILENQAAATSGDYRNFYEIDGIRYSHILDPRTGYPITNHVVSVTIISDHCTFADGLATGVMVLGPKAGLDLINRLENTEGLIITRDEKGKLTDHPSRGFIQ